jgi:uncharacterized protein
MHRIVAASILVSIGRSSREAFYMLWETLWALILGFTLSGFVQAFISKRTMQRQMGSRSPAALARATGFGMVSSSCSYAASAMSKSLFTKGADFITAMVFMLASTNLVLELGLILLVLMGWQFMAAEFVGGPIMIILFASLGGLLLTTKVIAIARRHLDAREQHAHHGEPISEDRVDELESMRFTKKVTSPAAWSDAASYSVADVTMLRRELLIGYLVAGFLAVLVPTSFWNALFIQGHGFWTVLENALVGPLIAIISWVCSIGNVPLAAALWSGGIGFGGVVAFLFADLIAMPLILIYVKFYGWKVTVRLVALFYVVMVIGGLLTEGIFRLANAIPSHRTLSVAAARFSWNYTTYLNFAFLVVAGLVWWLAKNRNRFGGGTRYAIDVVCGMQVRTIDVPARTDVEGTSYYFCSDRCHERFMQNPSSFINRKGKAKPAGKGDQAVDPICSMSVEIGPDTISRDLEGATYYFCGPRCAARFEANHGLASDPSHERG